MKPAPRRPRPSASARVARRAPALLALLLLLPACSMVGRRPESADKAAGASAPTYVAPLNAELGRILSFDTAASTAIVELSAFVHVPSPLAGRALLARDPVTLRQTARLVASAHRTGQVFGAYVIEGKPSPDDEVVVPPEL